MLPEGAQGAGSGNALCCQSIAIGVQDLDQKKSGRQASGTLTICAHGHFKPVFSIPLFGQYDTDHSRYCRNCSRCQKDRNKIGSQHAQFYSCHIHGNGVFQSHARDPLHTSPVNILVILRLADRHSNDGSHDEAHGIKRDPLPEWEHLNDRFPKKVGDRDDRTDDHHLERHGIDHGRIGDSHRCRLSLLRRKNTGYILFLHIAAVHFLSGIAFFRSPVDDPHTADHGHEHTDGGIGQGNTHGFLPALSGKAAAHDPGRAMTTIKARYRKKSHGVRNIIHKCGQ